MAKEGFFKLATVERIRGLKGELIALAHPINPNAYLALPAVFIFKGALAVPVFLREIKFSNNRYTIILEGYENVDLARKLKGEELYIRLEDIANDDKPENSPFAIIGYKVTDKTMGAVGQITDIIEMPSGLMAEVAFNGNEHLVPIIPQFIVGIDHTKKMVSTDLPQGLIE